MELQKQSWERWTKLKASSSMISNYITKLWQLKQIWNWHIKQWNSTESPESNPCIYGQLIYEKGSKNIQLGKNSLFNKWCCENWAQAKEWNWTVHLTSFTQINSEWITDLNVRLETTKLLKGNKGNKVLNTGVDKDAFLIWHQNQRQQKQK